MNLKQFVEKYGYLTASIIIRTLAGNCPADAQGAAQFHIAQELADDLEQLLRTASK